MWHSFWFSQGALGTESVRMACDASFGSTVGCAWDVPDAGGPELCWVGSKVLAECCERGFQSLHVMRLKLVMAEPKTSKNIWSIVTVPTPYDSYMILFAYIYIYIHNYTYTVCKLYVICTCTCMHMHILNIITVYNMLAWSCMSGSDSCICVNPGAQEK